MDFDAVDLLIGAWHAERPDVDVSPLEVFSRIGRIGVQLARVRAGVFAEVGLEQWGFDVLAALRRSGAPWQLSPGALQQETLVGSATTTHRVDRLEGLGYVERSPSPDDGRGVVVRLTDAGRVAVDRALDLLAASEAELLSVLPPRDRGQLAGLLRKLLVPLESGQVPREHR